MSPTPPFRVDCTPPTPPSPSADQQNGHFHSICLRSPADQPVVLSFDGLCNGSVGAMGSGEKSPTEGNSQGRLIDVSASAGGKAAKSKLPALPMHCLRRLLSSRRFLLALVVLLSILALLLIASLVLVIISWGAQRQQLEEDAAFLNRDSSWRDGCQRKCSSKFDVPPLLLISMDGFRADYLQRKITPSVARIMQCGSKAQYMMPSYPSKTFPNHFSIVTGLYPESHGIVDNHFYDEEMPEQKNFAKSSRNPAWYQGEPIWNTATKNGKKSAIFFWPGSEVPIQGMLPTYRYQYNASLPFSKRVDQVIDWLRLEEADRPAFLAMYFEQPDTAMHREGPDSDAVNSALIYVDAMINYLMQQLDNNGFLGCINLVILSDHGAQKLREDHFIALDKYADTKDPNVGGVFGGTIGHINFRSSTDQALIDRVLAPMSCLGGQTFRVYTRPSMPKRYHYTKSGRIGEIVIDSVGGTRLFVDQRSLREHGPLEKGDHGYDNRMREMRTIFGAWGPSIMGGHEEKPFQNIELYNFFTALMQLPVTAPNNGTLGRLHSLLRSPPPIESTPTAELDECEGARLLKCGDGCHFELNYQPGAVPSSPGGPSSSQAESQSTEDDSAVKVPVYNGQHCKYSGKMVVPAEMASRGQLCLVRLCNATLVFNRRAQMANFVESQLIAPIPNIDHRANCSGRLVVPAKQIPLTTTLTTTTEETTTPAAEEESAQANSMVKRSQDSTAESTEADKENAIRQSDPTISSAEDQPPPWDRPAEAGTSVETNSGAEDEVTTTTTRMDPSGSSSSSPSPPTKQMPSAEQLECSRANGQSQTAATDGGNTWISLFSDNDYARYIAQGQIRVPAGFSNGPWKQILSLLRQYVQHYKRLLMWMGPVFDHDHDGLADPMVWAEADQQQAGAEPTPSHMFLILLRCSNSSWHTSGRQCEQPDKTKTLAFVLPLLDKDLNCLFPVEYIFRHTARIRDVELLTGNEWFVDRQVYPADLAIHLRTQLSEQLWQLELLTP